MSILQTTVPSRNTDFNHLRDGFTRALVARQKLAKSNLTDQDDEVSVFSTRCLFLGHLKSPAGQPGRHEVQSPKFTSQGENNILPGTSLTDFPQRISKSLQTFKSIFPTGMTVPKGNSLVLIRTSSKDLVVEYDVRHSLCQ